MSLAAALALLAGCGQSGPLRLPPGAETPPPAATVPAQLPPGAQTPATQNPAVTGKDAPAR